MTWNYDGCLVERSGRNTRVYIDEHTPTWVRRWLKDELNLAADGVYIVIFGYGNDDCIIYQERLLYQGQIDWQPLHDNTNVLNGSGPKD